MKTLLNNHNVFEYLAHHHLCSPSEHESSQIQPLAAKNFNLLITVADGRKLLVKQERHNQHQEAAGEFIAEWRVQQLLQHFSQLDHLRPLLSELLHFDEYNSIIVFKYLDNYRDLMEIYVKEKVFIPEISAAIGKLLATIHRSTFKHQEYSDFLCHQRHDLIGYQVRNLIQWMDRIEPEIFGLVPADALKFFALYQRYASLTQAIAELGSAFTPSCLTHNDLKLNNILLHQDWETSPQQIVRLIDWERSAWGDPAFDLGMLIASYLQIWLTSLVISKSLTIEESLSLATIPLEKLQPSIAQLSLAYLKTFPEIVEHRPDFWQRVVQFVGLALIQQIHAMIQYQKSFGNTGIAMLQVAKTLLCRPETSMSTIFSTSATELNPKSVVV